MKAFGICLLLILTPATTLGEAPESILGTWHFDLVRTMSENIDRVAQARPDVISVDIAETQKAALSDLAEQSNHQATITVTKDTIISTSADAGSTTMSYTVIGGNSRLVIVESTDHEGYESVVNIRLVEGGIAIETTNCQENPEQCQRERRRAMEQLRKKHHVDSSTNTVVDGSPDAFIAIGSSDEPRLGRLSSSPPRDDLSQPRWVYFKQVMLICFHGGI